MEISKCDKLFNAGNDNSASVSVIIPSYNSVNTIKYPLGSLLNQSSGFIKEIIIVDSSDDGITRTFLSDRYFDKVKIILLARKTMQATARNIGAKNASGNILLFLDSDACLAQDWIDKMLAVYNDGCLVGSGSVSPPDFQKNKFIPLAEYFLITNLNIKVGPRRKMKNLAGSNLYCDRLLFEKVGGFPSCEGNFEDRAFAVNVSAVEKVWFIPDLICYHIFRQSLPRFLEHQKLHGKSSIIYRREYHNRLIYNSIIPLLLLPFLLWMRFLIIGVRVLRSGICNTLSFIAVSPVFLLGLFFWGFGFAGGCLDKNIPGDSK